MVDYEPGKADISRAEKVSGKNASDSEEKLHEKMNTRKKTAFSG